MSGIQSEQLNLAREGIVDPNARAEDRRRWIDVLFSYNTPQARAMIINLLQFSDNPDARRALCEGIARHAQTHPERLDKGFVEPLIVLLGSSSDEERTAAAKALADFPGAEVIAKLGAIARQHDVAMDKRLAAIDAMVSKVDSRAVIRELMALLEADLPQITERVVAALEPVSRETFGADLDRWNEWWAEKSTLDEEAWLADRLSLYRDRVGRIEEELDSCRRGAKARHDALTARAGEFQREIFRSLGPEGQTRLAQWLADPMPEIVLVSLELIKGRMADEGHRPDAAVLEALLGLLETGTPEIRLVVLEIVQNLKNEPAVVHAVLEQVGTENDPELRHALIKALGKLSSVEAVPTLVLEIADPHSSGECVREAAIALGHIAADEKTIDHADDAVDALKSRYSLVPGEDGAMRAALLTAMSGVGDRAFAAEFLEAIESDSAAIVRPALRGLRVIGDKSRLPRIRTLTTHPDSLVRVAALEAVGELGAQDADVESVLNRLNPTIETNELAREAAWAAFQNLLAEKPFDDRLAAGKRLREMPELEVKYLQRLLDTEAAESGNGTDIDAVYDRLATVLVSQRKYAEALSCLRSLYEGAVSDADPRAEEIGLRWLQAALRVPAQAEVADVINRLAGHIGDGDARARLIEVVARHLDSAEMRADEERTRALVTQLRSVPDEALGDSWTSMIQRAAARVEHADEGTAPSPEP